MTDRQHDRWNFTEFSEATPATVCEGYCLLSGYVASEMFGFRIPADCFCHLSDEADKESRSMRFRYEKSVYDFIVSAVNQKVEQDKETQMWNPGTPVALAAGCQCPDYDNRERTEGQGWIVSITCKLHGFHGSHAKVQPTPRRSE